MSVARAYGCLVPPIAALRLSGGDDCAGGSTENPRLAPLTAALSVRTANLTKPLIRLLDGPESQRYAAVDSDYEDTDSDDLPT